MNPETHSSNHSPTPNADETLRLIAALPAPAGLEDRVHARVHAALRSTPANQGRVQGRVLAWPTAFAAGSSWMRTAAAAAIAFLIVGGGWGVYSRVQPAQVGKVIVTPAHPAPGGFSAAGAMRTPQTLNGPMLTHPAAPHPIQPQPVTTKAVKKNALTSTAPNPQGGAAASAVQPPTAAQ